MSRLASDIKTEYRVQWTPCPTAYNQTRVLFVIATSKEDAEAIAKDHIERKLGIAGWIKFETGPSSRVPPGHVVGE